MPNTRRPRRRLLAVTICGLVAAGLALTSAARVGAQSGTRQGFGGGSGFRDSGGRSGAAPFQGNTARSAPQPSFEQRFWDYLQTSRYQNWAALPSVGADFYPGNSPHGQFVKLYANRTAAAATGEFPSGSILIKENYGPDREALMAVTVMYRSQGYDAEHQDWYWVKYEPNGQVSEMQGMRVAGQVGMCIECHSGAGGDFVFAND
ncbi:MAG: cytochrome P460 family protein [Planctomycetaceae bacterium]